MLYHMCVFVAPAGETAIVHLQNQYIYNEDMFVLHFHDIIDANIF